MSKSHCLRLRDVRQVYRLIGECRDLGNDWQLWRRHLSAGLCRLIGSQVGAGGEIHGFLRGPPQLVRLMSLGWADDQGESRWEEFVENADPNEDPLFAQMFAALQRRRGLITHMLEQVLSKDAWHKFYALQGISRAESRR